MPSKNSKTPKQKKALNDGWYRELYEFSPLMYFIIDSEGYVLSVNRKGAEVLGYKKEELLGQQVLGVFHPEDKELVRKQLDKCLRQPSKVHNWEFRKLRKDGSMLWVKESSRVITEDGQKFVFIICEDITEQKKTDADLKDKLNELGMKNRNEEIVSTITRSIHSTIDINDVFDNAVKAIQTNINNAHFVGIFLVEGKYAVLKAHRGYPEKLFKKIRMIAYPKGFTWKCIEEGKPLYCADAEKDDVIGPAGHTIGTKSYAALPIKYRGKTIGCITINSNERNAFSKDEQNLFKTVTQQIEVAVQNARQADALRESETRYRTLYDQLPVGVFTFDRDFKITSSNKRLLDIMKSSPDGILGLDLKKLRDQKFTNLYEKAIEGYPAQLEDLYVTTRSKIQKWLAIAATPLRDADGNIIGGLAVVEDVTSRKKMEESLVKSQKLESLGILAGGIAHDFNNLLTSIMGNLSIAKTNPNIDEELKDLFVEADEATKRASDLISQLLTFSKGGAPVKHLVSDFGDFISDIAKFSLTGSKAKCEIDVEQDLWNVEVDQGQFSQVIENLVINAQQAMPGGGSIKISVNNLAASKTNKAQLERGKYIKITIKDSGIGIPEENLGKIFDPYFTTKESGHGLGLSSVYSIVTNHHGKILISSKEGKGTEVSIYLPASTEAARTSKNPENSIANGRGRILLMDDEELIKKSTGRMLKKMGYEVEYASDGEETVDKYKKAEGKAPFDLVIMDLTIPGGMGGKEAIKILKSINPEIRAIVSSGYSNDPVLSDYQKYGFKAIVKKPYRLEMLSTTIDSVLKESL